MNINDVELGMEWICKPTKILINWSHDKLSIKLNNIIWLLNLYEDQIMKNLEMLSGWNFF